MTRADAQLMLEKYLAVEKQKLTTAIQKQIGYHWICRNIDKNSVLFTIVDKNDNPIFGQELEIRCDINIGEDQPVYTTNIGSCGTTEIKESYDIGDRGLYYVGVATFLTHKSLNEIVRQTLTEVGSFYKKLSDSIEWKI